MNNLKKALYVLLYDQFDIPDMNIEFNDETYIGYIIDVLIQKNDNTCPFKNYDCIGHCKVNNIACADGLNVDCNREPVDIWREFIGIESEE